MINVKQYYLCLIFVTASIFLQAQTVSGNLSWLANQEIRLEGFNGLQTYTIASIKTDAKGNFSLSYFKSNYGLGYLISAEEKPVFIILNGEDVTLTGESLSQPQSITVTKGKENLLFEQYTKEHPRREKALSAWVYLGNIYQSDALFTTQQTPNRAIEAEKKTN